MDVSRQGAKETHCTSINAGRIHEAMAPGDIEKLAETLYREAGYGSCEQAPLVTFATRLLGPRAVRLVPANALPGNGALARVGDQWRVYLRRDAPRTARRFVLLHELAHWALGKGGSELDCDALAAALLVPRPAFLKALAHTRELPALARSFGTTESCVALRVGETTGRPLALVTPESVRLRGEPHSWPTDRELRTLAISPKPGLRKATLRDDAQRVALIVV